MDLSPDQLRVHDAVLDWIRSRGHLLTVGGLGGCLSGNTIVNYSRGSRTGCRPITMRDLYLKFNGSRGSGRGIAQQWVDLTMPTYLPSFWPDGTVAHNRIVAVFESGVKSVIQVDFTGGKSLTLTSDHPVATPTREFTEAGSLSVGDIVLAQGTMRSKKRGGRRFDLCSPRVIVTVKHHPGPKKKVVCNGIAYFYARVSRARLVVEAAMNDISYEEFVHALKHNAGVSAKFKYLPLGRVVNVHHLDEDTLNDDISNLEVLPHAEHAKIHSGDVELRFKKDYFRELRVTRVRKAGKEMTYDVQMEPPANNFVANGVFVHNTGKTTVLSELAKHFPTPTAFITPTGRATSVLGRKLVSSGTRITTLQRPPDGKAPARKWRHLFDSTLTETGGPPLCTTYHRLLLRPIVDPKTEELVGWQNRIGLDRAYKLICLDEGSMISDEMLRTLQARGVPVLAVGDHGQLSPVKASGSLMQNPTLRLEQIHRQAEGSSIIALARHVRDGGRLRDFKGWDENCVLRPKSEEEAVVRETLAEPNRLDVTFIAWANKTRVRINRLARQLQGYEGPPVPGEPIVALHNYGNVCNGMRGILAQPSFLDERRGWILHANVEFPDDGMAGEWFEMNGYQFNRVYPFASLDELHGVGIPTETISGGGKLFDFSYCLTCHKAQGSQFDHVVVVYERDQLSSDEARRWNYTAISRASKKVSILV